MGTFGEWREQRWPLPEVHLAGFSIATIGASLSTLDDRRVISVVVDDRDGTAVVLLLSEAQIAKLDRVDDEDVEGCSEFARMMKRFHSWLADLSLDDNEVLGVHVDPVFAGFVLGDEPAAD